MHKTLVELFDRCCARFPDKKAFTCLGQSITYSELESAADHFSRYLQDIGLVKGDRIAIQMPNILQYPVAVFAAFRAGLTVVNTNPLYTEREMQHQFADAGVRAVVVLVDFEHKVAAVQEQTGVEFVIVTEVADMHSLPKRWLINTVLRWRREKGGKSVAGAVSFRFALARGKHLDLLPHPELDSDDLAFLQYTGGTTGVAKGTMLSHANVAANLGQIRQALGDILVEGEEILVAPLPVYHIFACVACMLLGISCGAKVLLIANPRDIPAFVKELSKYPFTIFFGLNTLFNALNRNKAFQALDFSHLKLTVSGGMALTSDTAEHWHQVTGNRIVEGYGLTETSPVISINPVQAPRIGSIGVPVPDTEVRIVDDERVVAVGEPGELQVRGPQVMLGYWQRPEETTKVLDSEGWLRTGDIAVQEADGYLRIVDRLKDMIIVSGFNVFPNEVEEVISRHPDVVECAAVGVPDAESTEAVKLFVVSSNPSLTEQDIRAFARENLTGYKVPRYVEFLQDLPKSNVGKVLRKELRDN